MGDLLATALALSADRSPAVSGAGRRRRGPKRLRLTDSQRIHIAVTYAYEVARAERRVAEAGSDQQDIELWQGIARDRRAILLAVVLSDDMVNALLDDARRLNAALQS
jgi:hypothetical protein